MSEVKIRQAILSDIDELVSLDDIAKTDLSRVNLIKTWVSSGQCYVANVFDKIVGYAVLNDRFFYQANVDMLYISSDFRGKGIGRDLLRYLVSLISFQKLCRKLCRKLWVTTNASNYSMQRLLESESRTLSLYDEFKISVI